jgi:hypothetical protein
VGLGRTVLLPVCVVALLVGATKGGVALPSLDSGVIDGKVALMFWPTDVDVTPLDPAGCNVHLVALERRDEELLFDCGVWFQPAPGKYKAWLETEDHRISAVPNMVFYSGEKFEGRGMRALATVVPAGQIALREPAGKDLSLRLIQLQPASATKVLRRIFDRRVRANAVTPVLMPAGQVLAGVFDDRTGDARALTRPLTVQQGRLTYAAPALPAAGTDVLAVLQRPRLRTADAKFDVALTLRTGDSERRPDVYTDGADQLVAVWYGVPGETATLSARSEALHLEPATVRFKDRVATVRAALVNQPSAAISVTAPAGADLPGEMSLAVHRPGAEKSLRTVAIALGETDLHLLPPEELEFVLSAGKWSFRRTADLRGGDAAVRFDLEPFVVSGGVFRGRDRARAEVVFRTPETELVAVSTDDNGTYSATLWTPDLYTAQVTIPGQEPHLEGFLTLDGYTTLDFHVPKNRYVVHLRNARDGKPISDGVVTVRFSSRREGMSDGHQATMRRTDPHGDAHLPPLGPGEAEIQGYADGFRKSDKMTLTITADMDEEEATLALEPAEAGARLSLLAPGGQPAEGAEIRIVPVRDPDQMHWSGVYRRGPLELPAATEPSLVLIRSQGAASVVLPYFPGGSLSPVQLLPEGPPLALNVLGPDQNAARAARLATWFGRYRMTTVALGFLTWSQPAVTNPAGLWSARGLPPSAVRVLAWRRNTSGVLSGHFDAVATEISYPWPPTTTLVAVD